MPAPTKPEGFARLLNEPVILLEAVRQTLYAAITFGLAVTPDQTNALMLAVGAIIMLLTRTLVTPNQLAEYRVEQGGRPTEPME